VVEADAAVRGRGGIDKTYLVHYGLRESLTHRVRFLRGLVGEETSEVVLKRSGPQGHVFVWCGAMEAGWGV
jgi:hypothetical protein